MRGAVWYYQEIRERCCLVLSGGDTWEVLSGTPRRRYMRGAVWYYQEEIHERYCLVLSGGDT